jgi:Trk K+ transport system NAD-binding subunit
MIVPRGRTVLKEDDRITTIGEPDAIRLLRKELVTGEESAVD